MAHLHALLAAESSAAILIKQGPGKCSGTIGWYRETDAFRPGQWVRHTIEPSFADLSPDGQHFIHWANTNRHRKSYPVYLAISRAPWLKALTFWGDDSWVSGPGQAYFFRDTDGRIKLWGWFPVEAKWDSTGYATVEKLPEALPWRSIPNVTRNYFVKLQRDGWKPVSDYGKCPEEESAGIARWLGGRVDRIVFEKPLLRGWVLRRTCWRGGHRDPNRSSVFETFALKPPKRDILCRMPWEWADWDAPRKRLVWTEDCQLFTAPLFTRGPGPTRLLFDARPLRFEGVEAPY